MGIIELLTIAVSLSMDAFAVAICKGLSLGKVKLRHCVTVGAYFGIFQGLMPLIGYLLASTVASKISDFAPYIAAALLFLIGANMVREALCGSDEETDSSLTPKSMLPLAVATSIDALAVGVSFALLPDVNIWSAVSMITLATFLISAVGVGIGCFVGGKFRKVATTVGGIVLIVMGIKFLLEGLNIL